MYVIPLAERKENLTRKKDERQLTEIPKTFSRGLMIVEERRYAEDHPLDVALTPKI